MNRLIIFFTPFQIVESMLGKVMQEFERRLANQNGAVSGHSLSFLMNNFYNTRPLCYFNYVFSDILLDHQMKPEREDSTISPSKPLSECSTEDWKVLSQIKT